MEEKEIKTSEQWIKNCEITVLNPDGWDRRNFNFSWYEEKITIEEFQRRLTTSTVQFRKDKNKNGN